MGYSECNIQLRQVFAARVVCRLAHYVLRNHRALCPELKLGLRAGSRSEVGGAQVDNVLVSHVDQRFRRDLRLFEWTVRRRMLGAA